MVLTGTRIAFAYEILHTAVRLRSHGALAVRGNGHTPIENDLDRPFNPASEPRDRPSCLVGYSFNGFAKHVAERVNLREMTVDELVPRNFCYNSHRSIPLY